MSVTSWDPTDEAKHASLGCNQNIKISPQNGAQGRADPQLHNRTLHIFNYYAIRNLTFITRGAGTRGVYNKIAKYRGGLRKDIDSNRCTKNILTNHKVVDLRDDKNLYQNWLNLANCRGTRING